MNKQMIYHSLDELDGNYKRQPIQHVRADGLRDYSYAAIAADPYGVQGVIMREVNMDEHSNVDWSADHDRCLMWDYEGFLELVKEFTGSGDLSIGQWSHETSKDKLLQFGNRLADLYRGDKPSKQYNGIRIIRNTNRSSGYPVFSIQMKGSTCKQAARPSTSTVA